MRPVLPPVSGPALVDALEQHGFAVVATVGAHAALRGRSPRQAVVVPLHGELSAGTLAAVLRKVGFRFDEILDSSDHPS